MDNDGSWLTENELITLIDAVKTLKLNCMRNGIQFKSQIENAQKIIDKLEEELKRMKSCK